VPAASAKAIKPMKLTPGACAVKKKAVNTGTIWSFQCNAQTNWCAQEFCNNGTLVQVLLRPVLRGEMHGLTAPF
jgi:hypothetical protein